MGIRSDRRLPFLLKLNGRFYVYWHCRVTARLDTRPRRSGMGIRRVTEKAQLNRLERPRQHRRRFCVSAAQIAAREDGGGIYATPSLEGLTCSRLVLLN